MSMQKLFSNYLLKESYVFWSVDLSVCLFVLDSKSNEQIFMIFFM